VSDLRRGLARRSVAGMFWTSLSMGALGIAEIIALVVLARLLSPEDFGLYTAALVVIKFAAIFSGLGVAPAIVQRPNLEDRHLRVGFTLSLLLSLAVAGIVWGAAPAFADFLRLAELTPVVRAACVVFLCQGLSAVAQATAQRALRFRWLAGLEAVAFAAGFVVAGPVLAWFGFGVWALVGAMVIQHLLRAVVLLIGQPHPKRPMLQRRATAELLYFGGGFTLARICNYAAGQADKLIVGRWLGAEALGFYALAAQLMSAPAVMVGQVLDRVLFPTMALVQQEPERLARAFRSAVAACALLVLPASVLVAVLAPELVHVLLGPDWGEVVLPLQILAVGMLFRTSYKLSDSIARATGAVYARAWRQAVHVIAIAIGALIGQSWGIGGVALGVVVAIAVNFLLMAHLSLRLVGMRWSGFLSAHLPALALAVVIAVVVWPVAERLRESQVPPIALLLYVPALAAGGSLLLCWLLPAVFLGQEGRSVLRLLIASAPYWLQTRLPGSRCLRS
jgi:O-antigen/teichoic acid export membrane protein